MALINRLSTKDTGFPDQLRHLLSRETDTGTDVQDLVATILQQVRQHGDVALCNYTQQFDRWNCTAESMTIDRDRMATAWHAVNDDDRAALTLATRRIQDYHQHQLQQDWNITDQQGFTLGQRITPLDCVGLYVPGGKAAYPSSVLMNAVPAVVAGVADICMVVPTPDGEMNDLVLAAAYIAGVQQGYAVGGAQAIAALAYGTATINPVDKIVGPGNKFVAAAKRQVFGHCGIDMIAGPSEIAIVADGGNPDWLAADFLSQAEHDEAAQSILISTDAALMDAVEAAVARHLTHLPRANIAEASLRNHGAFILVDNMTEAAEVVNTIAPEHLELAVDDPDALLPLIRHAGAIFMGHYVPEALGDYLAGPNHVLPTNRTARFSSPLGVYDFQKRSSVIRCDREALSHIGKEAIHLAHREGLQAHALTLELRLQSEKGTP